MWIGKHMEKLVSVIGQTSSGKSSLGIALAKKFNGEIISADSRQVYNGLDYCSGKVSKEEQQEAVHHLINVVNLGNQFSLYDFQNQAYASIDDVILRGKVPFLVGGTGLYSRAVVEGYNLSSVPPDEKAREDLETLELSSLEKICREKNIEIPAEPTKRRLIRLIEKSLPENQNKPKYNVLQIGIKWNRETIYERIKVRLEERMPNMLKEIKGLLKNGIDKSFLMSLGLEAKYIIKYFDGEFASYDEFFEELFKEERHFAKRQQTWYNKEKDVIWLDAENFSSEELIIQAEQLVEGFLKK